MLRVVEVVLVVGVFVSAWFVSPALVALLACLGGLMVVDRVEKRGRE